MTLQLIKGVFKSVLAEVMQEACDDIALLEAVGSNQKVGQETVALSFALTVVTNYQPCHSINRKRDGKVFSVALICDQEFCLFRWTLLHITFSQVLVLFTNMFRRQYQEFHL